MMIKARKDDGWINHQLKNSFIDNHNNASHLWILLYESHNHSLTHTRTKTQQNHNR